MNFASRRVQLLPLLVLAGFVVNSPRVKRAAHVLRGRPIMYGLRFHGGAIWPAEHIRIDSCDFFGTPGYPIPAIEITEQESTQVRVLRLMARRVLLEKQRVRTAKRPALP